MQYLANTEEARQFIADHLQCDSTDLSSEDIDIFECDELMSCTCCGEQFTSRFDFVDQDRDNGIWICHACDVVEEADDLRMFIPKHED